MDTLGAAHLGCYGYARDTSPHLDAFAARATRYARAHATAPWTLPSHASLFTGRYPSEHGARIFRSPDLPYRSLRPPLAASQLTLAEAFRDAGFRTAAFAANTSFFTEGWGLLQGFETREVGSIRAPELNRLALEWLEARVTERFFLFLNYMDTHVPYHARPVPGRPDFLRDVARLAGGIRSDRLLAEIRDDLLNRRPYSQESLEEVRDLYDVAVANLDEALGSLLARLEELGLYDETLIVLTSDHGEAFGQHDLVEHGKDVYQEMIHVPLLVKRAGQRHGEVVHEPVSLAALPRWILGRFDAAWARQALPHFPTDPERDPVLSEHSFTPRVRPGSTQEWLHRFDRERVALIEWPYKYIHSSDGRHELYDLTRDPGESQNRAEAEAALRERLARSLEAFRAARPVATPARPDRELSPREIENLKALGYL